MRYSLIFLLCTVFHTVFGWWATPHMLVGQVAYSQLTPEAKQRADALIALHAKTYPATNDFVSAAVWADDIKAAGDHTYSNWHYVDLPFESLDDPMPTRQSFPSKYHVAWAIDHEIQILKSSTQSEEAKGLALRRLIHWVGDIHQPLHAAMHISPQTPEGDKGGNLFLLGMPEPMVNLHRLWDGGMGQWPEVPRPLSSAGKNRLAAEAKRMLTTYGQVKIGTLDPYAWALESHWLARQYAYQGIDYQGVPSEEYLKAGQELTDSRVTQAGLRLAALLNTVFKK
jgi:hypothetical protein